MRARHLILVILAIATALLASACGGPDDPGTRMAEACERQIEEIGEEEGGTPTAKSTEERLAKKTLVECAGQEIVLASPEEDAVKDAEGEGEGDEGAAEDPGSGGDEAAPAELDPAARETFASTCGSCHTLSDAETTGAVGPNLDDSTLDSTGVAQKIAEGGGGMPPGLLEGEDAEAVATYVAGAAAQE